MVWLGCERRIDDKGDGFGTDPVIEVEVDGDR